MTKEDTAWYQSMEGNFIPPTDDFVYVVASTNISNFTNLPQRSQRISSDTIISLNYLSDNSAMVFGTLIGHHDFNKARERNKKDKENYLRVTDTYRKAKALTVIHHFNIFGCKVGKTVLQKKEGPKLIQHEKTLASRKKEEVAKLEIKRK